MLLSRAAMEEREREADELVRALLALKCDLALSGPTKIPTTVVTQKPFLWAF